jgi:DNA-binding MarR family transcriptional regulator
MVDDAVTVGAQLRSAVGQLYRRFASERAEGSLGDRALEIVGYLHKHGPHTLTALSDVGRVTPASMSQTVNRLAAGGFVVRTADPDDRRHVLLSTTATGDAVALATATRRNAWLESRLAALSAEDRQIIAQASALLAGIAKS